MRKFILSWDYEIGSDNRMCLMFCFAFDGNEINTLNIEKPPLDVYTVQM